MYIQIKSTRTKVVHKNVNQYLLRLGFCMFYIRIFIRLLPMHSPSFFYHYSKY